LGSNRFDFDVIVIGSGFGGSLASLRAIEKGYHVGVLESGRRWPDEEIPYMDTQVDRLMREVARQMGRARRKTRHPSACISAHPASRVGTTGAGVAAQNGARRDQDPG
jgi:choline dehydrogenase-like flavoprotein